MKKFFGKCSKTILLMGIMAGAFCVGEVKAAVPSDEFLAARIENAKKNKLSRSEIYWRVVLNAKKNPPASFEELQKIYAKEIEAAGLATGFGPKAVKTSTLNMWILLEKIQTQEEAAKFLEMAREIGSARAVLQLIPLVKLSDKETLKIYSEISEKIVFPSHAQSVFNQIKPLLFKVEEAEAKAVLKKLNRAWSGYLVSQKGKGWDNIIAQIRTTLETY